MKRLADFAIFVAVVKAGTISQASKTLDLSIASVSKYITRIEQQMGVRLLVRNSRGLKLTDEGRDLYEHVDRLLDELDAVVTKVSKSSLQPQGVLRITSSIGLARRRIAPLVSEFAAQYPDLSVQLNFGDRDPDTGAGQVDVAIVIGQPQDSSLVAKRILRNPCVPCASPAYLQRHPAPTTPQELKEHACLILDCPGSFKDLWVLEDESGKRHSVRVKGGLITDNSETLREWVLDGQGIAMKSLWDIEDKLESGELVRLLPGYRAPDLDFYLVYAGRELIPAKTRAFVAFLEDRAERLQASAG
ncbi:LysR family transcriptional regulator [Alloalcanivorax sp. C16-2]|uniref:LysR family transcriptional regulator n=1 Tax=Alloalcanivorax TaxID=3020832 RepID=UPI001932292A|nr:LysR family transcriptional regulator [Alloalcanivorax marinus]MBL7250204.1 LysR family transcriptional regulator [Alloalcanivorax marinus]